MGRLAVSGCAAALILSGCGGGAPRSGGAALPVTTASSSPTRPSSPSRRPLPGATAAAAPGSAAADWTTYQHDAARTGVSADQLSPGLHRVWTRHDLDGAVYAQP